MGMRGLDRIIKIERFTSTRDSHGQPVEDWSAIDDRRPASYAPVRGDERFTASQFIARQQVEFRIRWSADVADLSPLDRVVYPPEDSPISADNIYDIIEVSEIGRREGLRIIAARRSE